MREALRDLATLGVVEMEPYKGARVRQPNKPELVEQMELRGELEALAARHAAKKITPELLEELQGLINQMHELAEAGDVHAHAINNTEFHSLIMHAAGNATLERLWKMLDPYAHTYVTAAAPGTDLVWLGDRHVAIVEALEAGDPEAAADAMREHAKQAEEVVLAMDDDLMTAINLFKASGEAHLPVVRDRKSMALAGIAHEHRILTTYHQAVIRARAEERGEE